MHEQSKLLFKKILHGFYENRLEAVIAELLSETSEDPDFLKSRIAALCGAQYTDTGDFPADVMRAVASYTASHKIVQKQGVCFGTCRTEGEESPCQKSCPFNAIINDQKTGDTAVDPELCTDCGICIEACPEEQIIDVKEVIPLTNEIRGVNPVIAAVAPAIIGQFGSATIEQLRAAFRKMGFTDMIEVAFFADMLTLKEAIEFDNHVHTVDDFMITSCCCPVWVAMLRKVYRTLVSHVSPSVSPMIASGAILKKIHPGCKIVFVGPCVAKKAEAKEKDLAGIVDYVITFDELKTVFETLEIKPELLDGMRSFEYASRGGRLYARTGGVSIAVREAVERIFPEKKALFKPVHADGVKGCRELLEKAQKGELQANFIEGMGCTGGCVGGPKRIVPVEEGTRQVNELAESSEVKVAVDSAVMNQILAQIGIKSVEDFKHPERIAIFEREF